MLTTMLTLLACGGKEIVESLQLCEGPTQILYDPLEPTELLSYPDDWLTRSDPTSPTGHFVDLSVEKAPWTADLGEVFTPIVDDISTRSGFARLGAAVIRFNGTVPLGPTDPEDSLTDEGLIWLDLSVDPPQRVAFTTTLAEGQNQLLLKPAKPLRAGAKHIVVVTNEYKDVSGQCTSPSPLMVNLLNRTPNPRRGN